MAPFTALAVAAITITITVRALPFDNQPGAFPPYLCSFSLADQTGSAFAFDLRPVGSQAVSTDNGYNYTLSVCGVVSGFACNPTWGVPWPFAPAHQLTNDKPPGGQCYNNALESTAPCTQYCEPAGRGVPLHALQNPSNAATGGLITTFADVRTGNNDLGGCPFDEHLGRELGRSLQIVHNCDASIPAGTVKLLGVGENPVCNYVATVASAAACGVKTAGMLPPAGGPAVPPSTPGAGPVAPYLCSPSLADTAGKSWGFSLSQLFNGSADYVASDANGTAYHFNVCGNARQVCSPAYAVEGSWGGVVASYAASPPPPGAKCLLANGTTTNCTSGCHTAADGVPLWKLTAPANGATGGVTMLLQGLYVSADEPAAHQCRWDPHGDAIAMDVHVDIACDASTPANTLVVTGPVVVTAGCHYAIPAKSAAA